MAHHRAIPQFRVFLFMHRQHLIGGKEEIATGFNRALRHPTNPLEPDEAEAFRRVVLNGDLNYRKAGWVMALRISPPASGERPGFGAQKLRRKASRL